MGHICVCFELIEVLQLVAPRFLVRRVSFVHLLGENVWLSSRTVRSLWLLAGRLLSVLDASSLRTLF